MSDTPAARSVPPWRGIGHAAVRSLVLRGIGIVYAVAFASLGVQVRGLLGRGGIAPAAELLEQAHRVLGGVSLLRVPTLFWLGAGDAELVGACGIGAALGLCAAAGVLPRLALLGCWGLYLSLVTVGDVFLGYQWDALLLEAGLLAVFWAPGGLRPRRGSREEPGRVGLWLLRWLVFRLFFLSGVVKLASGDEAWRDLTALRYHYWTQPLPTRISVWVDALQRALPPLETFSVAATLAIELVAPFGIFGPRRLRLVSLSLLVLLQLVIASTGSYGFFNLLTIVLCLSLLDDAALEALRLRLGRARPDGAGPPRPAGRASVSWRVAAALGAVFVVSVTSATALERLLPVPLPRAADDLLDALAPLRSFNSYGLFAVMTKQRPEITLEGSRDGEHWVPYTFRWKPGPLDRAPGFPGLHMPRLDWQMWFAALEDCERAPWFLAFQARLLQGSAPVLGLLASNPFPDSPPREIRSRIALYHFADAATRRRGLWWERGADAPYCPPLALHDGRLQVAPAP